MEWGGSGRGRRRGGGVKEDMICCDAIREREHQEEVRCVSDERID